MEALLVKEVENPGGWSERLSRPGALSGAADPEEEEAPLWRLQQAPVVIAHIAVILSYKMTSRSRRCETPHYPACASRACDFIRRKPHRHGLQPVHQPQIGRASERAVGQAPAVRREPQVGPQVAPRRRPYSLLASGMVRDLRRTLSRVSSGTLWTTLVAAMISSAGSLRRLSLVLALAMSMVMGQIWIDPSARESVTSSMSISIRPSWASLAISHKTMAEMLQRWLCRSLVSALVRSPASA